jgi:serine/threonine-protein kinase
MTAPTIIDPDRERRLDEVLANYLNAVRRGTAPPRDELLGSHPDLAADLREFFDDQDCLDRLATPLRAAAPATPPVLSWLETGKCEAPREFGDYADLEEIARGGMGVVFKARQKSLNRTVALKMLLAGPLASADDVRRFRTEAESAAALAHPHIVPIYEVGTHDGYPYLSMQFMEGGSLATVAGRAPWRVNGRASARRVARVMIDIAAAVHHAHQRGILHRDLKPANILLDAAGKAHVSDFGLAKRSRPMSCDQSTVIHGAAIACGPAPLAPPAPTHTGAIVGTPAYMAPEQASGEFGAVTVAADVYGLGAVLYELLTGEPPFRGLSPLDTIRQVQERDPAAPSKHNLHVDRDLETICLKCLRKQPSRRYPAADDLARDLERYLNGEPIRARAVGPLERGWRWCVRHAAVAALTLALFVTLAGATVLLAALWFHAERHADRAELALRESEERGVALEAAKRDLEEKRAEAEQRGALLQAANLRVEQKRVEADTARAEADASFRMAHSAAVEFSTRILDEVKQSPGLQPLQKMVLEATLAYFEKFVQQRGNDPALRRELADTYVSMANITAAIGSPRKAEEAKAKALALYRELYLRDPEDRALRRVYAQTLTNLALLRAGPKQLETMNEARHVYEMFLEADPDDPDLLAGLANTLHNLGVQHGHAGRPREALEHFGRAGAIQFELLRRDPNADAVQASLATTFQNISIELSHTPAGAPGGAESAQVVCALHHARLLREDLVRRFPRDPRRRADVLSTLHSQAILFLERRQFEEAEAAFQEVIAARQKLADENPSVTRYQMEVADSHKQYGVLRSRRGDRDGARREYEHARDLYARLAQRDPDTPLYKKMLGVAWFDVSVTYGAQKNRREELTALEKSRFWLGPVAEADPDDLDSRFQLARTLNNLGLVLGRLDRYDDAVDALQQGAVHARAALERAPDVAGYRQTVNANLGTLGEVERFYKHADRAAAATLRRRELWPDNPAELYRVAADLARAAAIPDDEDERRRYGGQALETLRQARAAGFKDRDKLRLDAAFEPLREWNEFKQLLDEMLEQERP